MPKKILVYNRELFEEVKKLSKQANQRIVRIEREFGKDKWAVKQLRNKLDTTKLDAWTKTGRVKYNKSMSTDQLRAVKKFVKKFLESKTSRIKGIKETRKKQIESIRRRYKSDFDDITFTFEDAESVYQIFESDDYNWIYEYMSPSAFDACVETAIDTKASLNDWFSLLVTFSDRATIPIEDLDIREKCEVLYNKFVVPYI